MSDIKKCEGSIEIYEDGEFKIRKMSKSCPTILKKINPIRGIFWKNHMDFEEKKRLNLDDGID